MGHTCGLPEQVLIPQPFNVSLAENFLLRGGGRPVPSPGTLWTLTLVEDRLEVGALRKRHVYLQRVLLLKP